MNRRGFLVGLGAVGAALFVPAERLAFGVPKRALAAEGEGLRGATLTEYCHRLDAWEAMRLGPDGFYTPIEPDESLYFSAEGWGKPWAPEPSRPHLYADGIHDDAPAIQWALDHVGEFTAEGERLHIASRVSLPSESRLVLKDNDVTFAYEGHIYWAHERGISPGRLVTDAGDGEEA